MSDNRARTWPYICPDCGRTVHLSNLMRRYAVSKEGRIVRTNTHELTHSGAAVVPTEEVAYLELLDDEDRRSIYHQGESKRTD